MKCPQCGTDNKRGSQTCYMCGYKLVKGNIKISSSQQMWSRSSDEPSSPDTSKPYRHRNRYANKPSVSEPLVVINDEDKQIFVDGKGTVSPSNHQKLNKLKDGQVVRISVPTISGKKKKMNWPRFIFSLLGLLVVLAGFVFGFYKGVKFVSALIYQKQQQSAFNAQPTVPLVERVMVDGASWHKITFYGQDGERIMITEPRRTLSIHNGTAELMLEDASYIPANPEANLSQVDVALQATLFTASGGEEPIAVPSFSVEIPLSPLTVISPEQQSVTTNEDPHFHHDQSGARQPSADRSP